MEIKLYGKARKSSCKSKKRNVIFRDSIEKNNMKIEEYSSDTSIPPRKSLRKESFYNNKTTIEILELKKIMERQFSTLFSHTTVPQSSPSLKDFNI